MGSSSSGYSIAYSSGCWLILWMLNGEFNPSLVYVKSAYATPPNYELEQFEPTLRPGFLPPKPSMVLFSPLILLYTLFWYWCVGYSLLLPEASRVWTNSAVPNWNPVVFFSLSFLFLSSTIKLLLVNLSVVVLKSERASSSLSRFWFVA